MLTGGLSEQHTDQLIGECWECLLYTSPHTIVAKAKLATNGTNSRRENPEFAFRRDRLRSERNVSSFFRV